MADEHQHQCDHDHGTHTEPQPKPLTWFQRWRFKIYCAAISLPVIGAAIHAAAHVILPLFGVPCP